MRAIGKAAILAALFTAAAATAARADDRKFTYSYEAKTLPQGSWEFEQWATLETRKEAGTWNTLLLREEIEYGISDRLNGSIYLNTTYQGNTGVPGFADDRSYGFDSMSAEVKYRLTDPGLDPLGVLLYFEPAFATDVYELEGKLVLSKDLGPWTFAYNFVCEAELHRAADPAQSPQWTWEPEIFHTVGVSYGLSTRVALGVEAYDVARYDLFSRRSTRADYVGPNVHASVGEWWATLTVLHQVTFGRGYEVTDPDNTKWQARLVIGVSF
ncbi:MAG TPA: hypothetical protein VKW04_25110 [Planctomycetota bacterium]|nr:hypothetical protein [Planctomycetota bacterium]